MVILKCTFVCLLMRIRVRKGLLQGLDGPSDDPIQPSAKSRLSTLRDYSFFVTEDGFSCGFITAVCAAMTPEGRRSPSGGGLGGALQRDALLTREIKPKLTSFRLRSRQTARESFNFRPEWSAEQEAWYRNGGRCKTSTSSRG